jgi:hypothetical protein
MIKSFKESLKPLNLISSEIYDEKLIYTYIDAICAKYVNYRRDYLNI